ncbi:MAG: hypothetical protein ACU83U_00480 [Gammaproteobacteria bacterium]
MKTQKTILSLAISALLTAGVASYPMHSYAGDDKSKSSDSSKSKSSDSSKSKSSDSSKSESSDSDKRSDSGSGDKSKQKITVCHVPPGNPENKHTIHIAFSAWEAHKRHTNTIGPDFADYLGSCNNAPTTTGTTTPESLHVISGCTGSYREALLTKVQSYFDPITVADTALDDESVVTAMSQCLDKGDSDDSGKGAKGKKGDSSNSASGGQGRGHDSVSDSGNHHRIRGCQNKDTEHKADSSKHGRSDSDKDDNNLNYHKKLKSADSAHDKAKGIKDPVVVSDSSLDDSGVWREYKKCVTDANDSNKIDSGKTGKSKGDSGHKQHILKSCGDDQDQKVKEAITAYRAKESTKNIILTESSYNDVSLKQAVDSCVAAGATDTIVSSNHCTTFTTGTINDATIVNAVITNDSITGGTITAGTSSSGAVIGGTITAGTLSGGSSTGTTITGATVTNATVLDAGITITDAILTNSVLNNEKIIGGTITAGTSDPAGIVIIDKTITTGTITSGAVTTGATISCATVATGGSTPSSTPTGADTTPGVGGRLNFREITTPLEN